MNTAIITFGALLVRLGSRKFIISILCGWSAHDLMAHQLITPTVYGSIIGAILALYSAANVAQKWAATKAGGNVAPNNIP